MSPALGLYGTGERGEFAAGRMRARAMFGQASGYTVLWDAAVEAYAAVGDEADEAQAELGAVMAAGA
jgi:hypothetical protein